MDRESSVVTKTSATQTDDDAEALALTQLSDELIEQKRKEIDAQIQAAKHQWNQVCFTSETTSSEMFCQQWNGLACTDTTAKTTQCSWPNSTCDLTHKWMMMLPHGGLCLSENHTYVQHLVYFTMPIKEAQILGKHGMLNKYQVTTVWHMEAERQERLSRTKHGKVHSWISKFGLLNQCQLPLIEGTDIIDTQQMNFEENKNSEHEIVLNEGD